MTMTVLLLFFINFVFSATHPLTGSSIVNQAGNSMAFSQMGFKLNTVPLSWGYCKSLSFNQNSIELGIGNKTLLTFRMEKVSVKTQLERYVRQYLRDYNQYGFEVSSLHSNTKGQVPSVVVDLDQKNKATKSRQVFFFNQDKMVIATCVDDLVNFPATLALCNQVLSSFNWK